VLGIKIYICFAATHKQACQGHPKKKMKLMFPLFKTLELNSNQRHKNFFPVSLKTKDPTQSIVADPTILIIWAMSVSVINRLRMVLHELESTALFLSSGLFSCCRAFDFIVSPYETNNKPYVSEEGGILCVRANLYKK
jgi:hypothetical protein